MAMFLRSVFKQAHREIRPIGSRRNFSSLPSASGPGSVKLFVSWSKFGFGIYAASQIFHLAKEYPETKRVLEKQKLVEQHFNEMPELDS